jgi:hypothetical protein
VTPATGAPGLGGTGWQRLRPAPVRLCPRASVLLCLRAPVPLFLCALLLACTDPRPRVPPPTVRVLVGTRALTSPGTLPASIYGYDFQGFDSLRVALKSAIPQLNGDSLYLFPDTTEATTDVVWTIPTGVPAGTTITLIAKVWNLVGFAATDSTILTVY